MKNIAMIAIFEPQGHEDTKIKLDIICLDMLSWCEYS